jgi:type II secretory pathway predicted ATPase ExeA
MKPYHEFGLQRPPFEATPDPQIFYAASSHKEARATLEYAHYAKKTCTVVVADSGLGKSLLARIIAASASRQSNVLWLHGLGQSNQDIELTLFQSGALTGSAPSQCPEHIPFEDWLRAAPRFAHSPLLIVDNADELPEHGWRSLLALLSRDVHLQEPARLALFGTPRVLKRLAAADMVRLRRRIFRTCTLKPFARREAVEYVHCRLTAAGGTDMGLFSPAALNQMYRLSEGNPGLINQICDNAMLEAFGEGHQRISAADVLTAAQALTGTNGLLNTVWAGRRAMDSGPRALLTAQSRTRPTPTAATITSAGESVETVSEQADAVTVPPFSTGRQAQIELRLWQLEARLGQALATVRRAGQRADALEGEVRRSRTATVAVDAAGDGVPEFAPVAAVDEPAAVAS